MPNLTYTAQPEGYMVSNGKLNIIVLNKNLSDICVHIYQEAVDLKTETGDTRIDPIVWQSETVRLCELAKRIVSPDSGINIFEYLPLTKSGDFPRNQNPLIADSKCGYGESTDYPVSRKLQMRLVPAFSDIDDWIANNRLNDTMILDIQIFDAVKKQEPIFNADGIPHKILITHAAYLKDDEISTGHIYEEKSGSKYLCITGCQFEAYHVWDNENSITHPAAHLPNMNTYTKTDPLPDINIYIKWTNALEKAVGQDTSFNNIIREMAARDKTSSIHERLSMRENPRKFIREVAVLFDPKDIKPETIIGAKHKDPYCDRDEKRYKEQHFIYNILPYKR